VAISFMVRRARQKGCRIFYARRPETETAEEKLSFLAHTRIRDIVFEELKPDKKHNWINLATTDFESLLPLASKIAKSTKKTLQARTIFKTFSLGLVTARDAWLVDFDKDHLREKVEFFCEAYENERARWHAAGEPKDTGSFVDRSIKWTSELEAHLVRGTVLNFEEENVARALYRPFVSEWMYYSDALTHRRYQMPRFFPRATNTNRVITFLSIISSWPLSALATDRIFDYCLLKQGNGATQSVAYWTYSKNGERRENITDWALEKFNEHYRSQTKKARPIGKEAIFDYVYAVLHDERYREAYSLDLKRELPRVPLYPGFWQWSGWGKRLLEIHIGYERAALFPLKRTDIPDEKSRKAGQAPKPVLRANRQRGSVEIDSETTLSGVPAEAWEYKLANRTALEWILEQYKERAPKDPTVRQKFNHYRLADHKEDVITLLRRATTVSVETTKIVAAMKSADHG
jgi:predicted helicase